VRAGGGRGGLWVVHNKIRKVGVRMARSLLWGKNAPTSTTAAPRHAKRRQKRADAGGGNGGKKGQTAGGRIPKWSRELLWGILGTSSRVMGNSLTDGNCFQKNREEQLHRKRKAAPRGGFRPKTRQEPRQDEGGTMLFLHPFKNVKKGGKAFGRGQRRWGGDRGKKTSKMDRE